MRPSRTLPFGVAPVPGEALDSWLEAVAAKLRIPMGEFLVATSLVEEDAPWQTRPHRAPWLVLLRPREAEYLAATTGVAPARLHEMTLEHFDQRALFVDPGKRALSRTRNWRRSVGTGSRFCPDCLTDSAGRWQLTWRFGWSYACLTHHRLLADACPQCGNQQRRRPHPESIIPRPGLCDRPGPKPAGHGPRPRCLYPLGTTETLILEPGHPALLAQQDLAEAVAAGIGTFGVYRHAPQPVPDVLADVKGLGRRALMVMPGHQLAQLVPEDLLHAYETTGQPTPREGAGHVVPASAAATAAMITSAWSILGQEDFHRAGSRMRLLLDAAVERGDWISPTVSRNWSVHASPLLQTVHVAGVGPTLRSVDQLRYRSAAARPGSPAADPQAVARRATRTPSRIWPRWEARLDPPSHQRKHLGTALSAALMLVDSRAELTPVISRHLGGLIDQPIATHALQALREAPQWNDIQVALIRLADYLDTHEVPIDYARRRRLDYTDLLSESQWTQACDRTMQHPGSGARYHVARCFLFERASGLPATCLPHASPSTSFRDARNRFPYLLTPELLTELDRFGQDFLARCGITEEPLTWEPPRELLRGLDLPQSDPEVLSLDDLHRLVSAGDAPLTIARKLGTDTRTLRFVLSDHPAPASHGSPRPLRPARPRRTPQVVKVRGRRPSATGLQIARQALPRERLEHLYVQQNGTFIGIARESGLDRKVVARLADEYGLARHTHRSRVSLDRQWLHEQYVLQGRTLDDLGRETGMSGSTVAGRARECGVATQSNRQPRCPQYVFASAPEVIRPVLGNSYAIRRLRAFVQVVQYPTLTQACQAHGLSAATLSMQLQRLETDLGGPLLIRAGRGRQLELTDLGRAVVQAVAAWAHTLEGQPRETWDRAAVRRPAPGREQRKARAQHADAPGLDRFPVLLQPAVRTFDGRRRLLRFLEAAHYPSLSAYCRDAGTSPSAMTPQLQRLERDLQGQLLIRGQFGHRMRLTDFGEEILAVAGPHAAQLRARSSPGDADRDRSPWTPDRAVRPAVAQTSGA